MADYDVTLEGSALEYDTVEAEFPQSIKIDSTHTLVTWQGSGNDGFVQVMERNDTTEAVTAKGSKLEHDTGIQYLSSIQQIDSNHFALFYVGNDVYVQTIEVNLTTWAVSEVWTRLTIENSQSVYMSGCKIDTDTFVVAYKKGTDLDGYIQVVTVDTWTWTYTAEGTALKIQTGTFLNSSVVAIDTTHVMVAWYDWGTTNGYMRAFAIDGSYNVTTAGSEFTYESTSWGGNYPTLTKVDDTTFICFWQRSSTDGRCQIFTIDGSYTITAEDSAFQTEWTNYTAVGGDRSSVLVDSTHALMAYATTTSAGVIQTYEWNWSYEMSEAGTGETISERFYRPSVTEMEEGKYMVFWMDSDKDWKVQMLTVEIPAEWWGSEAPAIFFWCNF